MECSLKEFQIWGMTGDYELELVAPRPERLYCNSYAAKGYSGSISDSLCTACLSLDLQDYDIREEKVPQLLNMVSSVKTLFRVIQRRFLYILTTRCQHSIT